jgi:hypothetical protein
MKQYDKPHAKYRGKGKAEESIVCGVEDPTKSAMLVSTATYHITSGPYAIIQVTLAIKCNLVRFFIHLLCQEKQA